MASVALATVLGYALVQQSQRSAQQLSELAQLTQQMAGLQQQLQAQADTRVLAVLSDAQAQAQLLVRFSPSEQVLLVQRLGNYRTAADRDLQLWALPPGQAPTSLGVLGRDATVRLALPAGPQAAGALAGVPALAVSLEPLGGAPSGSGPTGPVLFQGAVLARAT